MAPAGLRALLCLSEMTKNDGASGGMAELVRNDLFPSVEEISALAMQFGVLPGASGLKEDESKRFKESHPGSSSPVPAVCEGEGRGRGRRGTMKDPLDMDNSGYERLLEERRGQPLVDYIHRNIVSECKNTDSVITLIACPPPSPLHSSPHRPMHTHSVNSLQSSLLTEDTTE